MLTMDVIVSLGQRALAVDVEAVGEAVVVQVMADGSNEQHQLLTSRQHVPHRGGLQELRERGGRGSGRGSNTGQFSNTAASSFLATGLEQTAL